MLLDSQIRSQFQIEIISNSVELGGSLKTFLSLAGYQVKWLQEEPKPGLIEELCHVTLLDVASIRNLSHFIEQRLKQNQESIFVLVGPVGLSSQVESFRKFGVYSTITEGEGIESQALMELDLLSS